MRAVIRAALIAAALPAGAGAQVLPCPEPPRTRLEAMAVLDGVVVIRGSARIGAVRGEPGSLLFVTAREFTNASTGERAHGLTVEVRVPDRPTSERIAYVDLEEIPPLLAGLEHLTTVQRSATALEELEADYRTRGGLVVTVFNTAGGPKAAVTCGPGGPPTELELSDFLRFRQLLQSAFDRLNAVRGGEAK